MWIIPQPNSTTTEQIGWIKIAITAVASSLFTACLTVPLTAWIQRRSRRKEMRRALYWEIVNNFGELQRQILLSRDNPEMRDGIGDRFAMGYKRLSYDMALRDSFLFYSLGHHELYWIDLLYRDFEQVTNGQFKNEDQRFNSAKFVVGEVLSQVKNRDLSKHQIFAVSPRWVKKYLRQELPSTEYIDIVPLRFFDHLHRRYDKVQYWLWRRFYT